jgi:drug/metabolite transporter (DMT)-like permease
MFLLSIFSALQVVLWILGLRNIEFSQSTVLEYTYPLFSIPLSYLILREMSGKLVWAGATIGFMLSDRV